MADEFKKAFEAGMKIREVEQESLKEIHTNILDVRKESFDEIKTLDHMDELVRRTFQLITEYNKSLSAIMEHFGGVSVLNVHQFEKAYHELGEMFDEISMDAKKIERCMEIFEKRHKHEHKWCRILNRHLKDIGNEMSAVHGKRKLFESLIVEIKDKAT